MKCLLLAGLFSVCAFSQEAQPTKFFTSNYSSAELSLLRSSGVPVPPLFKPQVQFFIIGPPTTDRYTVTVLFGDGYSASAKCDYGANSGIPGYTLCVVLVDAPTITRVMVSVSSHTETLEQNP